MKKQKTAPGWCNDWWWPILQEEKSGIKQNCVQRRKKKGGVSREGGREKMEFKTLFADGNG